MTIFTWKIHFGTKIVQFQYLKISYISQILLRSNRLTFLSYIHLKIGTMLPLNVRCCITHASQKKTSPPQWYAIDSVHPAEGEGFYLRILLNHFTDCTSYQDIRTHPDGTIYYAFKEATYQHGLLDVGKYDLIMEEIPQCSMPPKLRQLIF